MNKVPKLSIVIINYNGAELLPSCLKALENQDYTNSELWVVDQGSSDESVAVIEKDFPRVKIHRNTNTGYSGGANKAYEVTDGDYLVVMNADISLEPDYFSTLIAAAEKDPMIGAVTGKIIKPRSEDKSVDIFDTTGLMIFRNRRVVDRGQGFEDHGQFDEEEEVFGVSGCLAFYRRKALDDIKLPKERFYPSNKQPNAPEVWDNDFFMYKEDIDVSWRLHLRGWKCLYDPKAIAYHARGTGIEKRYTDRDVLKHRKKASAFASYYSYKNQRLMQVKNEIGLDLLRDLPRLWFREILIFGYILIREPRTLKSLFAFYAALPRALRKRRYIQKNRKIKTMLPFMHKSPKMADASMKK